MVGHVAAFVLVFVQVALGEKVININTSVDKYLNDMNRLMTRYTPGLLKLPPFGDDQFQADGGVDIGQNSYYRIKDAFLTVGEDESRARIDFHASRRLFRIAFGSLYYLGDSFSAVFEVVGGDFHVVFDVLNLGTDQCNVTGLKFELINPGKVFAHTSLSQFEGDNTEFFEKYVLHKYNEFLAATVPDLEKTFKQFVCNPRQVDDPIDQYLASIMENFY